MVATNASYEFHGIIVYLLPRDLAINAQSKVLTAHCYKRGRILGLASSSRRESEL